MAKEDKTDEKPEEPLSMVGDGADAPESPPPEEPVAAEAEADDDSEDEGEEGDERVGHSAEEEESGDRKALREKRRQERRNRREKDARLRREVNFLRARNEQVERQLSVIAHRQNATENLSIDSRIANFESQIRQAEEIHSKAVSNKDGETATEAMRIRAELEKHVEALRGEKQKRETRSVEIPDSPQRMEHRPPETVVSWVKSNEWFDPSLRDETSHLVKIMEDRLAAEGEYTADQPEYWEELDRRIDRRFPNLRKARSKGTSQKQEIFEVDDEPPEKATPKKKTGGPRFSVGGQGRALKPNEVYINAERRKALEEAGVWGDPELMPRYLKAYKAYDEDAAKNS